MMILRGGTWHMQRDEHMTRSSIVFFYDDFYDFMIQGPWGGKEEKNMFAILARHGDEASIIYVIYDEFSTIYSLFSFT